MTAELLAVGACLWHHVQLKPINAKYINIIHACTRPCYVHRQPRVLIRVTSVPSLIWSGFREQIKAGPEGSGTGLVLLSKNFLHYINIRYPPTADTISLRLILNRPPQAGLSSRWARNPRQSDNSRRDNGRGKICPATAESWRESRRWERNQAARDMGKKKRGCFK